MTPGRDLDQDMHALRLSRQDNPFVQKVLASRESLIDTLDDDQSDDAILMASEEINPDFDDPFTLPEVKEHMIRSPPPTNWPRSPAQYMFTYNQDNNNLTISSHSSDVSEEEFSRCITTLITTRFSSSAIVCRKTRPTTVTRCGRRICL